MKSPRNRKTEVPKTRTGKRVGFGEVTDPGKQGNVRGETGPTSGNGKTSGEEETGVKKANGRENGTAKMKPRKPTGRPGVDAAPGRSGNDTVGSDGRVLLQVRVRPALRREVRRRADEEGVTSQTYVLMALRDYGVDVRDDDLLDLRKGEHRARRADLRGPVEDAVAMDALNRLIQLLTGNSASARSAIGGLASGATGGGLTLVINNYLGKGLIHERSGSPFTGRRNTTSNAKQKGHRYDDYEQH